MSALFAGAAVTDISPLTSQFLFGYPHADRWSKGVHDPLLCGALYLDDGSTRLLIITNDIIYFDKLLVREIRKAVSRQTGIPPSHIMLSASHTHSAPVIVKPLGKGSYAGNAQESNPLAHPHPDPDYLSLLVRQITKAARKAAESAAPARIALTEADNTGIGTNRRDPTVPVLSVKHQNSEEYIAVMMACSMHPTVLHEDSLLVSADFPGMTRAYLQKKGIRCPILYASSPAGNQSPRHVTRNNTFEEAERIGAILGKSVEKALSAACDFAENISLQVRQTTVELPLQPIPSLAEAGERVRAAVKKMKGINTPGQAAFPKGNAWAPRHFVPPFRPKGRGISTLPEGRRRFSPNNQDSRMRLVRD